MKGVKLAILDFDGTLYRGDSMRDFARFLNPGRYYFSLLKLLFVYLQVLTNNASRDDLKALFLKYNFQGYSEQELNEKGKKFYDKYVKRCYPSALEWIAREQRENTKLLILSGSCPPWLRPFSRAFGADLICTELSYENDICTGKWIGKNMTGEAKYEALKHYLSQFPEVDYSIAFGDKKSDAISGALADEYHQNYFH
ncbi:MAG: HAD-IB family phosphatase [bacterium]|nr:HAD-IB family phosphatase [bacterium]